MNKINIFFLIKNHISSFKNEDSDSLSKSDIFFSLISQSSFLEQYAFYSK